MDKDSILYGALENYESAIATMIEAFQDLSGIANNVDNHYPWLANVKTMLHNAVIGNGSNGWISWVETIAFAIALSFFMISIITAAMGERLTPEQMVHQGAKLALTIAGVMWAPAILETIVEFGEAFGDIFAGINITMNGGSGDTIDSAVNKWHAVMDSIYLRTDEQLGIDGLFHGVGHSLALFLYTGVAIVLTMLIIPIIEICMIFVQITRYIELYVRGTFLPISFGLMADEGWRGPGGRYIRKIMSIACQNAAIMVTLNVTGVMLNTVLGGEIVKCVDAISGKINNATIGPLIKELGGVLPDIVVIGLVICVAGIAFMFKSIQVMDDLWGAR